MPHLQLFMSCLELVELCDNGQNSYPKQDFSLWLKFQDAPKTLQLLCAVQSCQQEIWGLLKFVLFWCGSSAPCSLCTKCRDALGWKIGNTINAISAVRLILLPQEVSMWWFFFFLPGFPHQQNAPYRCGSTSPCHCDLFPQIKVTVIPPLPLGELQQTDEMLHREQLHQEKTTNQPTKKARGSRTHKKQCRKRVVSQLASDPIPQTSHLPDYLL